MGTDEGGQYRVAVVQVPPVVLDRQATLARAVEKVGEAADNGARLVAFSEAFVPGYPDWIWRLRPDNFTTTADIWERFLDQTVDLERDELQPLREVAKLRKVAISVGINEREGGFSRTTVYNSVVVIGADGEIALRHRKLIPTNAERMVWGAGDGYGLEAVETPIGRVAGLICWENYMPLARFALFASGVQIYLAPTWDMGDRWVASMRHIAFEGGCWVLGCGSVMRATDIPADLPMRSELYPDPEEWINRGIFGHRGAGRRDRCGPSARRRGNPLRRLRSGKGLPRPAPPRCCRPLRPTGRLPRYGGPEPAPAHRLRPDESMRPSAPPRAPAAARRPATPAHRILVTLRTRPRRRSRR